MHHVAISGQEYTPTVLIFMLLCCLLCLTGFRRPTCYTCITEQCEQGFRRCALPGWLNEVKAELDEDAAERIPRREKEARERQRQKEIKREKEKEREREKEVELLRQKEMEKERERVTQKEIEIERRSQIEMAQQMDRERERENEMAKHRQMETGRARETERQRQMEERGREGGPGVNGVVDIRRQRGEADVRQAAEGEGGKQQDDLGSQRQQQPGQHRSVMQEKEVDGWRDIGTVMKIDFEKEKERASLRENPRLQGRARNEGLQDADLQDHSGLHVGDPQSGTVMQGANGPMPLVASDALPETLVKGIGPEATSASFRPFSGWRWPLGQQSGTGGNGAAALPQDANWLGLSLPWGTKPDSQPPWRGLRGSSEPIAGRGLAYETAVYRDRERDVDRDRNVKRDEIWEMERERERDRWGTNTRGERTETARESKGELRGVREEEEQR